MKKLLTLVLALALAISCLALTACGGDTGVEGTYKLYQVQMTTGGTTVTFNLGDEAPWGDDILTDANQMVLKADGVCEGTTIMDGEPYNTTGTYVIDGETISVTQNGETAVGSIKDGTITVSST